MPKRHKLRYVANDPAELASRLPQELQSFDSYSDPRCTTGGAHAAECECHHGWYYPNGLSDYMSALSEFLVGPQRLTPVMNAAGLSTVDWFRSMLGTPGRYQHDLTSTAHRQRKNGTTQPG